MRDFLFDLFRSTAPNRPRDELPTTAEVFAEAVKLAPERFATDPGTQAEFLAALAKVYADRGMSEAIAVRQQVLALREPLRGEDPLAYAMAQATLARELAGRDNTEAARLLGEAIPAIERLAPDSRDLVVAIRARSNPERFVDDGAARQDRKS